MPYEQDSDGNYVHVDKPAWPKFIYGDVNVLRMFIEANWPVTIVPDDVARGDEGDFLAWIGEWYPELYEEFNKVLDGKAKFDEMPKYDLKEV
jgi:hypothetical protein